MGVRQRSVAVAGALVLKCPARTWPARERAGASAASSAPPSTHAAHLVLSVLFGGDNKD